MNEPNAPRTILPDDRMLISLALATVLIHFLSNGGYGYFRDELYAIACSKHLAWGYVDQPPFSEFVLALSGHLLGYSLFALRLLPALCGGFVAFLVGLISRELGGARFAQALAATAFIIGGVYLAIDNYYSMNCFDHLFWALAIYILVRILKGGDTRLWLLLGLVAGLGLENKYSMGFFGIGLIVGLVLTPARKHFLDKWLWVGGALAAVVFLPHVLWEVRHHFPTAEFIQNATLKKNLPMTPWAFLRECALLVHPFTLPIWLAGLTYVFFVRAGRKFQTLGWIFLAALAILLSTHSKPYYSAPCFPTASPRRGCGNRSLPCPPSMVLAEARLPHGTGFGRRPPCTAGAPDSPCGDVHPLPGHDWNQGEFRRKRRCIPQASPNLFQHVRLAGNGGANCPDLQSPLT